MEKEKLKVQIEEKPMGYGRFKMVLDEKGQPIDATILEVNPAFESQFGEDKSNIVGKSKFEFFGAFYEGHEQEWLNKYNRVAFEQTHFVEIVHFKPLDIYFEMNVSSPVKGEFITLFQDVTARHTNDKMYQDILNHMSDAVFMTDDSGKLIFVSPGASNLFGRTAEELYDLTYIENIIGHDYKQITKKKEPVGSLEQTISDDDGHTRDIIININQVKIDRSKLLFVCHDVTHKNLALKEAKDQRERLRAIINTIPDLVWMKDTKGSYLACNKEFESFYNISEENLIGKNDTDFVSKEEAKFFREHDVKAMSLNKPSKNEERLEYQSIDKVVDVETTKTPFYDSNGMLVGVLGIARDITERKAIQTELQTSNTRLEQLINTVDGILWEADPETFAFSFISNKVKEVLGYTPEEWLASPSFWIDHLYEEDKERAVSFCLNETKKGKSHQFEFRFYKKDGSIIWVKEYVTVVKDENGKVVNLVGLTVDIDEQLKNKKDLEKYERFFDLAQDNFCIANAEGKFVELNPQLPKTLGYTYEELKDKVFLDLVHPADHRKTINEMQLLAEGAKTVNFKNRYLTKSGDIKYFNWSSTPHDGLYYAVARDITNEVEANLKKQESERKYRNLINAAGDAIYLLDENGIILDVNEASSELTGHSRDELIGSFIGAINKDHLDEPYFRDLIANIEKNKSFLHESVHIRKDGSEVPIELNIRAVEQENNLLYFAIARDISWRKIQENRFSQTVENAPYGIALVDSSGKLKLANYELARVLGYQKEELYNMQFKEFTHPEDLKPNLDLFKQLKGGEIESYTMEKRYISKCGDIKFAKLKVTMIEDPLASDGVMGLAMVEDLTEIKKTEARHDSLVETAPSAIYTLDPDGKVIETNRAAREMLGYTREEFKNAAYTDFDPNFTKTQFKEFAQTLDKGVQFESTHKTTSNKEIPVEINIKSFESDGEEWIVGIVSDISERKKAEFELKETNAELVSAQKIAKVGNWRLDVVKDELSWSDEIYRIFDAKPKSFKETVDRYYGFVHPEDRERVKKHFDECARAKKDFHLTHRIISKQGQTKFIEEKASFEYGPDGALLVVKGTAQDVTETELFQQELKLRDQNLNKFFTNVHVGIARNSMDGTFLEINPEFERFTGYSKEELNQMSYWDLTPQTYEKQEALQLDSLAVKGSYGPYQKHYRTKEGDLVPVLLNGVKTLDTDGNEYIWSVVQDLTESEEYKNRLQQDVEKFKLLLEIGKLIAFEVDLETREIITMRDKSKIDDSAFPMSKIKNFDDFFHAIKEEHRIVCERKLNTLLEGEIDRFSCDFQIKNGNNHFWYEAILTVLALSQEGIPTKVFITLRNIEEEKNQEERQIISQEKERLRISRDIHDSIGQMLVGTRLTLNVKKRETKDLQEIDELLDAMIKESRLIINNFGVSIYDNKNLRQAFRKLNEKMNKVYHGSIKLNWEGRENIDDIKTATHIFRIYQEALSNAIKYSQSETIEVNVRNTHRFLMKITDNGIGFDPETIEIGFGIKNMQERAAEILAKVDINSRPGKGTMLELSFKD